VRCDLIPLSLVPFLGRGQSGPECPSYGLDLAQGRLQLTGDVVESTVVVDEGATA
jgi:hypothetical protein